MDAIPELDSPTKCSSAILVADHWQLPRAPQSPSVVSPAIDWSRDIASMDLVNQYALTPFLSRRCACNLARPPAAVLLARKEIVTPADTTAKPRRAATLRRPQKYVTTPAPLPPLLPEPLNAS